MTFTNDEGADERWDRLIPDAVSVIREYDRASASLLQRRLRVGYARAARIIDQLEALGHVGAFDGTNDRLVLRREDEFVAPEQATSDPRLMEAHATLTIARSVLGVGTPSLSDLGVANVDDLYRIGDLYDFECASCGRLSEVYEAATAVEDAIGEMLGEGVWPMLQGLAVTNELRPAMMQRKYNLTFEAASEVLETATNLGFIRRSGNAWTLSPPRCSVCVTASRSRPEPRRQEREPIPAQMRFRVLQRDGFRCVYCGQSTQDGAVLHVDHVVPVVRGGQTAEDNLITACASCNLGKAATQVIPDGGG